MSNSRPIVLNNVYSTVQAGSTAIGSSSATGITVATGDGANFGTLGTDEYIPAVIVDTSTSPETVKEYVWITARSTDTLTVKRQAEESSRYAASTTTIQSGYTIAAVASKQLLDMRSDLRSEYLKPDGAFVENLPRPSLGLANGTFTSGTLYMMAISLPAGMQIGHINFASGTTAQTSPTHWWFGLYDNNLNQLAVTADQTTTVWAANTYMSLAIATIASGSSSTFTTTYTGLHYIGIMQAASTTATMVAASVVSTITGLSPALLGKSDTSQTTPPAFPHTAAAFATATQVFWGSVSS